MFAKKKVMQKILRGREYEIQGFSVLHDRCCFQRFTGTIDRAALRNLETQNNTMQTEVITLFVLFLFVYRILVLLLKKKSENKMENQDNKILLLNINNEFKTKIY